MGLEHSPDGKPASPGGRALTPAFICESPARLNVLYEDALRAPDASPALGSCPSDRSLHTHP